MRRVGALAGAVAALLWTCPVAAADPASDDGPGNVAPTMTLPDMGASGTIAFTVNRFNASKSVSFPVLRGLVPEALRAHIEVPVALRFGALVVSQNGRQISRVTLPLQNDGDLVIPLKGVQLSGDWLTLNMALTVIPAWEYCWDDYAPIRLTNAAVSFSGSEVPPKTVAEFVPAVLRKVTIGVPANPSRAESSAAVQVATALAQRNGQKPDVTVVALPEGATTFGTSPSPLERQIVVKEGEKGLSLQGDGFPALLVSGKGDELVEQARLLSNESLDIAVSTTAIPGPLPEPELVGDIATLEELKQLDLSDESLWPKVTVTVDQTRFGHPLENIRIHLIGSYTPLPENFGGEATITVDGQVLDRWEATGDGIIDRGVTIPARLIGRSVNLVVAVRATGNPGHCGDHLPIAVRIDSTTSEVLVANANPPVPQGFQSFPQALMPVIDFGIGDEAFADTARAVQIAVGLQRLSSVPLMVEVTSIKEAINDGGSAVLISSGGWDEPSLELPFTVAGGKISVQGMNPDGDPLTMNLEPETKFGSLQTVFDGKRSLMIATSNDAPWQLDSLLKWLDGSGRWSGLNGRAIISVPDGPPLTVPNPPIRESAQAEADANSGQDWFWWAAGGIAAIASVGALLILLRARRSTGSSKPSSEQPEPSPATGDV